MMSPTMKMTTKSSTAMMSSVTRYYCCMRNYVIVIIEIISRICEGLLCAKFDNIAYICENYVLLYVVKKLITVLT